MYKLGVIKRTKTKEHIYRNEYAIQKTSGPERLIITTEKNQINLALELIGNSSDSFGVLYLLLVSRLGNKPGRYQIKEPFTKNELTNFCKKYSVYLESDGRHHIWFASTTSNNMIVYDNHNVLYAYGAIAEYEKILKNKGYKKTKEIIFPAPHSHNYNNENDSLEEDIVNNNNWLYFELREGDDY